MKRDWELVRDLLTKLEEMETTNGVLKDSAIDGYSTEIVSYHINLLSQAGLVEASCMKFLSGPMQCSARRLTWQGHEFLDQIRTQTVWNRTKELVRTRGIELSLDTIKFAAQSVLKGMLE